MSVNNQKENSYVMPTESAAEMARLINQDRAISAAMGDLFPANLDLTHVRRVLSHMCWITRRAQLLMKLCLKTFA